LIFELLFFYTKYLKNEITRNASIINSCLWVGYIDSVGISFENIEINVRYFLKKKTMKKLKISLFKFTIDQFLRQVQVKQRR